MRLKRVFCQSEIENLRLVTVGDKNVRRLDVAVDDVLGMGGLESVCHLNGELQ